MNGRVVFRVIFLVGFCWFFLFAATIHALGVVPSAASFGERQDGLVVNYVSKRRVPNGPDPIHNRRIGNTRQPPNRA